MSIYYILVNQSENGYDITEICVLQLEADDRWITFRTFGFEVVHDTNRCGALSLSPISNGRLHKENLQEFVDLIIDFTLYPTFSVGFTVDDILPTLEELGLIDYYFKLLYASDNYRP